MPVTYSLIASNTLGSSAASVTFSSIPSTYTDLVLKWSARDDYPTTNNSLEIQINGVTSASYSETILSGSGSAASSQKFSTADGFTYIYAPNASNAAGSTSNTFANAELYIPSYLSSVNKPMSLFTVTETNATATRMQAQANLFVNTSAITSIKILSGNGYNFVSGSSFFLYGIKNS